MLNVLCWTLYIPWGQALCLIIIASPSACSLNQQCFVHISWPMSELQFFVRNQKPSHFNFGPKDDCGPLAWGRDNTFIEEEYFDAEWLVLFEEFVGKWQKIVVSCSIFSKGRGITKPGLSVLQAKKECRSPRSPWPGGHDLGVTTHRATFPQVGTKPIL